MYKAKLIVGNHCGVTWVLHCTIYTVYWCGIYIYIVYTVHYTVYTLCHVLYSLYIVSSVQCTLYDVQCTTYTVRRILLLHMYTVQCTVYMCSNNVRCTLYVVQRTTCTVQCTVHVVRCMQLPWDPRNKKYKGKYRYLGIMYARGYTASS